MCTLLNSEPGNMMIMLRLVIATYAYLIYHLNQRGLKNLHLSGKIDIFSLQNHKMFKHSSPLSLRIFFYLYYISKYESLI
jgi:hypothetical protein